MYDRANNQLRMLADIPASAEGLALGQTRICDRGGKRVFGLFWDMQTDTVGFNIAANRVSEEFISGRVKPTKRKFLKIIMSSLTTLV